MIDVEVLDFSVMFVQFVLISTIIRKMGKERKRLTYERLPSILAFPMAILEIHGELLSILQVFHIPLLYKSKKSRFCERLFQKFYEILIFQCFSGLSPSTMPVWQQKESALIGRLGALLRPTWQSYAGLPPEEGACVTRLPFRPIVILSRRRRILVHADGVSN